MILMPEAMTLANRKVVMPPNTQSGMVVMTAANLAITPRTNSQMAQDQPAWREATAVREMTPLFWAKVVSGREVACDRGAWGDGAQADTRG